MTAVTDEAIVVNYYELGPRLNPAKREKLDDVWIEVHHGGAGGKLEEILSARC